MTNSAEIKTILDSTDLDYKTYISLNASFRSYLCGCARYGISNPVSKFKPGDIVVRRLSKSLDRDAYGVPLKWLVISCAYGLIIGRRILGKRFGRVEVVNDSMYVNRGDSVEVDPEYIDSLLLDMQFDPNNQRNISIKLRRTASKYNKSISLKIKNADEAKDFFKKVSPGDTIYAAPSLIGLTCHPRRLLVMSLISLPELDIFGLIVKLPSQIEIEIRSGAVVNSYVTIKEPYPLSKIISV